MFFKKFLMLPALLLAASGVRAQTDTLQAKVQEVQITASHESRFAVGSRYVKVDSLALEQYRSSSLADLLQRYTPLYFKTYGHGMLATVSFRGTAANHTAVLWNGLNISLPTLGLTDFSTIPATALTSVAVQHGPAGANYGSASLGGTVLLGSELEFGKQLKIETRQETGSFGYRYHSGAVQAGNKKLVSRTSYFYSEAENNFKYKDITAFQAPIRTEEHAAVWQKGITQDVQYKASLRTQVALRGMYSYNDREIQAAMGSNHGNAKQQDENLRLLAELNHLSGFGETTVKAAFFKDVLDYTANMVDSDSEVHTWQLQVAHEKQLTSKLDLKTGINAQYFIADVSGYGSRKTENRASAFVLLRYNPLPRLHLNLNWRQARIEDYGAAPAPSLGAEYLLWQKKQAQVTVKGNASRSYRVPSLNERFWPTGDPHLKPESGFGYETGVRFTNEKGTFTTTAEATVYQMQVQNWVQWQPVNDGWSPVNLQQVKSSG
ncbi:MAG: TonB-dependent receptor, partial [Hymenobacteraceae bacterium]|nr:TonB-dependent receptor [Hymenobacteraceae bacterium]MDX5397472.1 TonB-dependent receptor [Hymenobacteraceae bacterium]MDX5513548.1 TonB-dependent receptor [Hymenobacteraceae bacterium]